MNCANAPKVTQVQIAAPKLPPAAVRISVIKILEFLQYNNGANWDVLDGPDVYVKVDGDNLAHKQISSFLNANVILRYIYPPDDKINLSPVTEQQFSISLYNRDDVSSNDQFKGAILFYPYL